MNECIPVDQLGTLKQLSADDPRRRHASACPRCSSLLFAFEAFVEADAVDGANPVAAEMQLGRFIAAHIEGSPAERASGSPRQGRGRWFERSLVNFAAVAAILLIAVVVVRWQPWQSKEIVYRGEASAHFAGLRATAASDGSIDLYWDAVKGADSYRVTILAQDLGEITQSGSTTSLFLHLKVKGTTQIPYYWQVTALVEGAALLTSDPQRLP